MSRKVTCWPAGTSEISAHFAIRHQVFVEEQGVMVFTDVDHRDRQVDTLHVVGAVGSEVAGTVRLYRVGDQGRWKGDRLAVLPAYRSSLVGVYLVRFAVAYAAAEGGIEMEASIQVANTRFFERLGWRPDGEVFSYYGMPHRPMLIDLSDAPKMKSGRPERTELHLPVDNADLSPLLVSA